MNRNKMKVIVGVLCITICVMVIGFATFSSNLNISGTSSIESNWKVVFTNIQELSKTNGVTINNTPTASGTTATFDVSLESPGDTIEYQITVENSGTLDAIIENIKITETESSALLFEVSGIENGDKLAKGAQVNFTIRISYDKNITTQPESLNKKLSIHITYVQDIGQVIEPEIESTLVNAILSDNTPQSDANINFNATSKIDGTKGLYYTNKNTEDNKTTYYFRGAVENNYVEFAGFYWRIIRINEDGSIRLIYQGETSNATGVDATIEDVKFSDNIHDNANVGYMYGTVGSNNYSETHANINDSTIKQAIDDWYEENLLQKYSIYLADAGFCGDRSVAPEAGLWNSNDTALGYGTKITYYGASKRFEFAATPQFTCPQRNDLYTVNNSKGNQALNYPIGLITADEITYAGGSYDISNNTYYLYIGVSYWSMSPWFCLPYYSNEVILGSSGSLFDTSITSSIGLRPVVNLKSTIEIIEGGNGTQSNPYVIS